MGFSTEAVYFGVAKCDRKYCGRSETSEQFYRGIGERGAQLPYVQLKEFEEHLLNEAGWKAEESFGILESGLPGKVRKLYCPVCAAMGKKMRRQIVKDIEQRWNNGGNADE